MRDSGLPLAATKRKPQYTIAKATIGKPILMTPIKIDLIKPFKVVAVMGLSMVTDVAPLVEHSDTLVIFLYTPWQHIPLVFVAPPQRHVVASKSFVERYRADTKYIFDNLVRTFTPVQKKIIEEIKKIINEWKCNSVIFWKFIIKLSIS